MDHKIFDELCETAFEKFLDESGMGKILDGDESSEYVSRIVAACFKAGFVFGMQAGFGEIKEKAISEIMGKVVASFGSGELSR